EFPEPLPPPFSNQGGRWTSPPRHPLNQSARRRSLIADADVILGLEVGSFWATVNSFRDQLNRTSHPITKAGTKLISISTGDLYMKSNYQNMQRYTEVDLAIAADAE